MNQQRRLTAVLDRQDEYAMSTFKARLTGSCCRVELALTDGPMPPPSSTGGRRAMSAVIEEYYEVRRYDPESDTWWLVPGGDHIPQWTDTVGVYDRAKGRRPDRRHRITRTVVAVEVVQEDEEC